MLKEKSITEEMAEKLNLSESFILSIINLYETMKVERRVNELLKSGRLTGIVQEIPSTKKGPGLFTIPSME